MKLNPSPKIRVAIYLLTGIGSLVVGYLQFKGIIGEGEVVLWSGVAALVNTMSAANVSGV